MLHKIIEITTNNPNFHLIDRRATHYKFQKREGKRAREKYRKLERLAIKYMHVFEYTLIVTVIISIIVPHIMFHLLMCDRRAPLAKSIEIQQCTRQTIKK